MTTWVEVWIDSASGRYVLLLLPNENGRLDVADPQEGLKIIQRFETYDEASHWLNEDEYDLVEGRWTR